MLGTKNKEKKTVPGLKKPMSLRDKIVSFTRGLSCKGIAWLIQVSTKSIIGTKTRRKNVNLRILSFALTVTH